MPLSPPHLALGSAMARGIMINARIFIPLPPYTVSVGTSGLFFLSPYGHAGSTMHTTQLSCLQTVNASLLTKMCRRAIDAYII